MRTFFLILAVVAALSAGELHLPLEHVSKDHRAGTVKTARIEPGVSGFVVHHFTPEHSAIVANAVVSRYDEQNGTVHLKFSDYTGLRQASLPKGEWQPEAGDEIVLAFAYGRGVLVAPTREIYRELTRKITTVDWVHPDTLATFLSYRGHPTPLAEDLRDYCTVVTTGLLFLYLDDALFTLDCQSLAVLQISRADLKYSRAQLPFYSRVEEIDANWFGKGSSELDAYEPHYFELMAQHNPHSQALYNYLKAHPTFGKALLQDFDIEETP